MAAIQGDFKEFNSASAASVAAVLVELFVIDCVLSEARDACIECPCARTVQDFYVLMLFTKDTVYTYRGSAAARFTVCR